MSTSWDFGGELPPAPGTETAQGTPHERVQASPEFVALRRRLRGFVFPVTTLFLLWYLAFVLLASYARELMATPVLGGINLGLVIGLAQFASTFALTAGYVAYAKRRLDPLAERIREDAEAPAAAVPSPAPAAAPVARVAAPNHRRDETGSVSPFGPDTSKAPVSSPRPVGLPR